MPHFLHDFRRKMSLLLYSISWPKYTVWLPLLREILNNIYNVILCEPGCDVINFEINFVFLIKPFFLHEQKFKTNLNILSSKNALTMK